MLIDPTRHPEVANVEAELPRWRVLEDGGSWKAHSPNFAEDGIVVMATNPVQLVDRVRALVQVVAVAQDRAGLLRPDHRIAGAWDPRAGPRPHETAPSTPAPPKPTTRHVVPTVQHAPTNGASHGRPSRRQPKKTHNTGEFCAYCGNPNIVRTGTCGTCLDCGESTVCG